MRIQANGIYPHIISTKHPGSWSPKAWGNSSVCLLRLKTVLPGLGPTRLPSQLSTCQPSRVFRRECLLTTPAQTAKHCRLGDVQLPTALGFLNCVCVACMSVCAPMHALCSRVQKMSSPLGLELRATMWVLGMKPSAPNCGANSPAQYFLRQTVLETCEDTAQGTWGWAVNRPSWSSCGCLYRLFQS